jgi:hypothetical protein
MDKQKLNTSVLIFLLLFSVFNIIPSAGGDITVTVYSDTVFPVGHFNFSVNPARNFRYVEIGTSYIRFNHVNISCASTNGVNVSVNNIASSLSESEQFKFTATASTGTAWFNITGLTAYKTYTVNRDSSSNIVCVSNASGGISFSESSWSSHTYTGCSGAVGSNLRSDGSHLFMTMEDGITPNIEIIGGDRGTISIDSNSTIEGKYCVNINRSIAQQDHSNLLQPFFLDGDMQSCSFLGCGYAYGNGIMPTKWSIKFMVKERTGGDFLEFDLAYHTESSDSFYFKVLISFSNNSIYVTDYLTNRYFTTMSFQTNCIYTLSLDNIVYRAKDSVTKISNICDVTLSNATSSQTITDVDFYGASTSGYGRILPIAEFCWTLVNAPATINLFFDDWTVGTQSNISTTALWPWSYPVSPSIINETKAMIPGIVNNDGSPLQNNTEFNNTVSVLYDTVPHNTSSYTYYFNYSDLTINDWSLNYDGAAPDNGIYELCSYNNKLYAASGITTGELLVYDGTTWSLNYTFPDDVRSLSVYNNNLYAGLSGSHNGDGDVYVFDGNIWTLSYDGSSRAFYSLATYNNKLYAGQGGSSLVDGFGDIYVFDGSTWSLSYDGSKSAFYSLAVYNNKLYAGQYGTGATDGDVYVFDGATWSLSYDGSELSIDSLGVYNNNLYAGSWGGDIFVFDGSTWGLSYAGGGSTFTSLIVYNGKLFASQKGVAGAGDVYVFDGSAWSLSYDGTTRAIYSLAVYDSALYAGLEDGVGGANDIYKYSELFFGGDLGYIIDSNENTYGYTTESRFNYLINHTGNSSSLSQSGNISKIEVRAKSNLSSGCYDGSISLQPVWNQTNGTMYNVFSTSSASWSDWIDITQDVNYSHPDWNDTRQLQCRVIANLSSGIAFVGMVELKVSINRSLDYAYNASNIGTYHTGDTTNHVISGLTPGKVYFYRTKINTTYTNSSSYYYGDEHYFLTKPYNCTGESAIPINETCINISWTKGTGANTTVLVNNSDHYPTSPYDGTIIYNGTGTYYLHNVTKSTEDIAYPSYVRAWSYDEWHVNPILWHYSDNYTEFGWSIVGFNVFNESNPSQAINFDLLISTPSGDFNYYAVNCNNTHFVNITNIPTGSRIDISFSNSSYRTRTRTMPIYNNTIYNITQLLPLIALPPEGIPEGENYTRQYRAHVINEIGQSIADAYVVIKAFNNVTNLFETIETFYTNGYGDGDVWLLPSTRYKVDVEKSGYISVTGMNWDTDPTFWGENYPFIIQLVRESFEPQPPIIGPESILFTGTLLTNTTLQLLYLDTEGYTESTQLVISAFNYTTNLTSIIGYYNYTSTQTWTVTLTDLDRNMTYICNLTIQHTYLGTQLRYFILETSIIVPITPEELNTLFDWIGTIPFGFSNFLQWIILVAICYYADSRDAGKIIIIAGIIFLFFNTWIGLTSPLGTLGGAVGGTGAVLFILLGVLMEWNESKRRRI